MIKDEFMKKYGLTEKDYRNLVRYEETRKSGVMNMFEYLYLMKRHASMVAKTNLILKAGFTQNFETVKGAKGEWTV